MALIAIGVAAFLLIRTERQIGERASALRAFDRHAREASDALAEARVAQHGYVAAGQGEAFWMSKVTATTEAVERGAVGAAAGGNARGGRIGGRRSRPRPPPSSATSTSACATT